MLSKAGCGSCQRHGAAHSRQLWHRLSLPPHTHTRLCRLGVAGLAMDVRLLVCRFIWNDGFGTISDALRCLQLCRAEGATISSNSWGGVPQSRERFGRLGPGSSEESVCLNHLSHPNPPPPSLPPAAEALSLALKEAQKAGMLFVVAAGNDAMDIDADPIFPASSKCVSTRTLPQFKCCTPSPFLLL